MNNGKYTPRGYQTVTPYFTVEDAGKMMEFIKTVFGGIEMSRASSEVGTITHAEVRIGATMIELSAGNEKYPPRQNTLHVFVGDVDDCYRRALDAGAISLYEPEDMPYGERSGGVEDPFGNHWYIATFTGEEGQGYYK